MHFYLYKITNIINSRYYIGVHETENLDDGYMGSGKVIKQAIKKYGIENFKKDILETFGTAEEMYKREEEVISDSFLLNENTYNLKRGGKGGWEKHSEQTKQHISLKRKEYFENGGEHPKGMLNKEHTLETKEHLRKVMKEKSSLIGKKGLEHPSGGTKWYNNGVKHIRANKHPGGEWQEGRIFKTRKRKCPLN
jgi:hypothetical protein